MLENFGFYLTHSVNDLRVNGRRTFFALLCIAAGVAAIVSLQTLAVMIQMTLTGSLQESNRGDLQLQPIVSVMESGSAAAANGVQQGLLDKESLSLFGQQENSYRFSQTGIQTIQSWVGQHYPGSQVTYRQPLTDPVSLVLGGASNGTSLLAPATGNNVSQVLPLLVDPKLYPFYGQITSQDGKPLSDLISAPTDIVLSEQVNQTLQAKVGDLINIDGSDANFTVRGVVDTAQEIKNPTADMFASLFGFYYLDLKSVSLFPNVKPQADLIFVKLADPMQVAAANDALTQQFPFVTSTTTDDLRKSYTELSDNINQLVTVMGLLSMLIGSIGIINTMQVIVRRRTVEVAVLKTLGLQANQITMLFLVEAIVMGIVGSLFGIVLGWGATFLIRGVAERLLATNLPFVLVPQPAITGFVVGVIVTAVFGFLPTLTAGQVRPNVVLRPTDAVVPKAGRLRTLLALIVIILALSLIAQTILDSFTTALAMVVGAFVFAGFLYLLLTVLIWLVGRFVPWFGLIDLKLSLRQMLAGRSRAAMTLLALVIGVFSLSTITLMADSINNLLQFSLDEASGGNVTISVGMATQLPDIERVLQQNEGVHGYQVQRSYTMKLVSVQEGSQTLTPDDLRARLKSNSGFLMSMARSGNGSNVDAFDLLQSMLSQVGARDLSALPNDALASGRQLTLADSGQPVIVIRQNEWIDAAGIGVGDKLTYQMQNSGLFGSSAQTQNITFEVVGVTKQKLVNMDVEAQNYAPSDAFPASISPNMVNITARVDLAQIPKLRSQLSSMLGVFVIDNAALTRLVTNLMSTFTAFPSMVALLGLIVGGVVIANSVALTTMERRREIAVMKSVGLQRERVLFMILLENGILGLIGGLIGVGIGLVALVIMIGAFSAPGSAIPISSALLLMLLCVAVALVAAISTAWGTSGEKPLNVLRYE